ncbi:hypothetical protein [Hymenobacter actinosclerus]|uniref:Uncharacterized protein n=1 Tax=Hymenobacter actinosclerus TaxID=82805 RepID=A0A1I0J1P3_9BACT|nr:hypothetical protein [Hymenobacter actinosclerus]SEU02965.1 hypothetical protein SAMN04487998_3566 [Hymenobacter actinosclerus]
MADKYNYSEVISEMLIQLQQHSEVLIGMQQTQERILDRLDRGEAGFNYCASAVLGHLAAIRSDLRDVRTTVLQDHEERLRRRQDFMRRAS